MDHGEHLPLVYVVDDDVSMTRLVLRWLERAGFSARPFENGEACVAALAESAPDTILLDLQLPDRDGLDVLRHIVARHPRLPVIMMTAESGVSTVVAAMQIGARDYLTKPLDRTKLTVTVKNAVESHRNALKLIELERFTDDRGLAGIIGHSEVMRRLFGRICRVADSDITVLIQGESGTGKELVARAIHEGSGRAAGPFVAVNCASIPANLQEDELFGHEKGAFTGAATLRRGRFEQADGGTLFLDEVAELTPALQASLLRVLQERSFYRVGGDQPVRSDFRLLTATHRDLKEAVTTDCFRQDLYFRLAVFILRVPPLRERTEDIPPLAQWFLRKHGPGSVRLSAQALLALESHPWPGNVRELENAIQRALIEAQDEVIHVGDLPLDVKASWTGEIGDSPVSSGESDQDTLPEEPEGASLGELERQAIERALNEEDGNVSRAARRLGIGRTTLYRKLDKYQIDIGTKR